MKTPLAILYIFFAFVLPSWEGKAQQPVAYIDFFGIQKKAPNKPKLTDLRTVLSESFVLSCLENMDAAAVHPFLDLLLEYKDEYKPDDWLFYQAIRNVTQYISPKTENYYRYTFYKWWFLTQSGYDARLLISNGYILFYVQSDETIYNIPSRMVDGKQYVCLNYHDYGSIDFNKYQFTDVTPLNIASKASKPFSYKVRQLPDFRLSDYAEKEVQFSDGIREYAFRIKVNPQVKNIFTNYPVVDYDLQFNMPLSRHTYESLILSLKKELKGLKQKDGVEFLMRFTRYAFLFKPDTETFGSEKRLTPEQTLLYEYSDCEDRAALFFLLVKEIYSLPMLVLTYPQHVTVAVKLDKAYGKTIKYNGMKYTLCEPSPQRVDLRVGQTIPELSTSAYQIAYAYQPSQK